MQFDKQATSRSHQCFHRIYQRFLDPVKLHQLVFDDRGREKWYRPHGQGLRESQAIGVLIGKQDNILREAYLVVRARRVRKAGQVGSFISVSRASRTRQT